MSTGDRVKEEGEAERGDGAQEEKEGAEMLERLDDEKGEEEGAEAVSGDDCS